MKIFVAGGTSGIGWKLASDYLEQGHQVAVCGRNLQKIPKGEYPLLKTFQLDMYNKAALETAIINFAGKALDMMIISAGEYADDSLHKLTYAESTGMLKVNIAGTVNALEVAREAMANRQQGHIVVLASVSGLLHYKKATLYSKSKRAVIQIADAYRKALHPFGITVTVVAPGYVDTGKLRALNNNDLSKKPFVISCAEAVDIIKEGIAEHKELIIFPRRMKYLMRFLSALPPWLQSAIMYRKAKWMNAK